MDVSIIKARQKINEFANHCQEIGNEKVCFRDHLFARIQRMVDRRRLTQDPRFKISLARTLILSKIKVNEIELNGEWTLTGK